jgi:hypothetical protein
LLENHYTSSGSDVRRRSDHNPPSVRTPSSAQYPSISSSDGEISSSPPLVGEVCQPFWVQESDGKEWAEPDDISEKEIERVVSSEDKRVLWEMLSVVMEYSSPIKSLALSQVDSNSSEHSTSTSFDSTHSSVSASYDLHTPLELADLFGRKEFRALWSQEGPESLPTSATMELIRKAYTVQNSTTENGLSRS